MKAITAFGQLANYPGPGNWPDALMINDIINTKTFNAWGMGPCPGVKN
jgi:hypothetical protein